jgi:5'-deoxynucleotidase YfbR-like HD superfamily hydrolase
MKKSKREPELDEAIDDPDPSVSLNPWSNVVCASSGEIRRLSNVWRYSSIPITTPENVADHSFWVVLYAVMIHQELQRQSSSRERKKYGKQSVLLAIMLKAATHDMGEAVTGDVVRPFKYSSSALKKEMDRAEKDMIENLIPTAVKQVSWLADQTAAQASAATYVDAVVKAADFMSLYQFMRREVLRGNCEIRNFLHRMVEDFSVMHSSNMTEAYPLNKLSPYYQFLEKESKKLHAVTVEARRKVV